MKKTAFGFSFLTAVLGLALLGTSAAQACAEISQNTDKGAVEGSATSTATTSSSAGDASGGSAPAPKK